MVGPVRLHHPAQQRYLQLYAAVFSGVPKNLRHRRAGDGRYWRAAGAVAAASAGPSVGTFGTMGSVSSFAADVPADRPEGLRVRAHPDGRRVDVRIRQVADHNAERRAAYVFSAACEVPG